MLGDVPKARKRRNEPEDGLDPLVDRLTCHE
jgi:hypothetical protein